MKTSFNVMSLPPALSGQTGAHKSSQYFGKFQTGGEKFTFLSASLYETVSKNGLNSREDRIIRIILTNKFQ